MKRTISSKLGSLHSAEESFKLSLSELILRKEKLLRLVFELRGAEASENH